jgi:nitrogen regulatory protein P-II 2
VFLWLTLPAPLRAALLARVRFVTVDLVLSAKPITTFEQPCANIVKLIIAIVQPAKLEAVKEALTQVEVFRLTVVDCQGFGRQKGQTGVYRGHEFSVNLLRKVQLQIAVNEEFVQPTVDAILAGGRSGETGEIGDGKIFVLPMDDCIRIRTGERGNEAI